MDEDGGGDVTAAVRMARGLGLAVIADGVTTSDQLERLRVAGCNGGQGAIFAAATNAESFEAMLAAPLPRR